MKGIIVMTIPAVIHIVGEDAIVADLDELPNPTHSYIVLRNLRTKNGKQLSYLTDGATTFLYAWSRITFIEILAEVETLGPSSKSAVPQGTAVLGFFRDEDR
jgi:hypothetical protein